MDCEYPDLQKTVLATVEANEIGALLNRDVFTQTPILHSIVKTNNMEMCKIILPAIPDTHIFHCHDAFNRTFLEYAIYNGTTDCIKYLLDCLQSQAKTISIGQCIGEESMPGVSAFTKAYAEKNVEIIQLLVSYLKEEELHFAAQAAVEYDGDGTIVPGLLSKISSNEVKYDTIHGCDAKGNTLLKTAVKRNGPHKFVSWFVHEAVKGDDPILIKPNDTLGTNAWIDCHASYSNIMEAVFHKFKPKARLQHVLMMNFERKSLITECMMNCAKEKREAVIRIIISALAELTGDIDDIDSAFPLFELAVSINDIEFAKTILLKTAQSIKQELFINNAFNWKFDPTHWSYVWEVPVKRKWNVLNQCKDFKPMLQMLKNEIQKDQNTDLMKIIHDDDVFHECCQNGMERMNMLLSVYDESYHEQWTKSNENHENPFHLAVASYYAELATFILKRIANDTERLRMIMQQTKAGTNAFDVANKYTEQVIHTCMFSILENIQTNDIHSDAFMSYFQWLVKLNELDSIRKLFDTFNHKEFILKALVYQHRNTRQNSVHIACAYDHWEILEYLLSFVRTSAKHQNRLFLCTDTQERTPLMISCSNGFIKCTSVLLQALESNPKLLSALYSMTSDIDVSALCEHLECTRLVMSHCDTCDLEMLQKIFIYATNHSKHEVADIVLSTAKQLQIERRQLFDYVDDQKGVNALYVSVAHGNTKDIKMILKSIDTKTAKFTQFVSDFRSYSGRSLMHAACASLKFELPQLILSFCAFTRDKHALLLGRDHANNNPLQIYLSGCCKQTSWTRVEETKRFVDWYLSNVDPKDKLSVICNQNAERKTALHYLPLREYKILEMIVADCGQGDNVGNISAWSMIVRIILTMRWDGIQVPLHIIKSILNNYPTDAEKMKLLTIRDSYTSKNVFDCLSGATPLSVFTYLLSFIKQKDDYKLLIHPAEDGNTLLHRVMGEYQSHSRGSLTLGKLKHIMSDDSISNALLSLQVIGSGFTLSKNEMILFHTLNTTDRISLIMDEFSHQIFPYVHDHEDELMPKLLRLRSKQTQDTLLMRFFRSRGASKYLFVFNWLVSWIKKLDPTEIVSFITATNLVGDTALHLLKCVYLHDKMDSTHGEDRNTKYVKDLLALLPTQAIKEKAILQKNHQGITPFMSVIGGEYTIGSAYIMWNNIQNMDNKLRLMNRNWQLEENKMNDNWKDWCKQALRVQTNPLRIDDVELSSVL
eukprot:725997_1